MRIIEESEFESVSGGFPPIIMAAMWLGRAGAVGGLIGLGYYFYNRP